ncbi:MAG: sodium:alanine symporter family protein [Ruminococcaceae bacterium]|nr:sodium:alanine symporter family protein [Oscillospiraceae bacterium]
MLEIINFYLSGVLVPSLLIAVGLYYCIRLKFFHVLKPFAVFRGLKSEKRGGVSSARAVTLALAGTLGVGNIVGVSSAIHLGGFGAVFWMWASALVAMILKYAEIVLAMKHKKSDGRGGTVGAAMYYIKDLFSTLGARRFGSMLAAAFAALFLLTSLTMGSMLQSNAIAEALEGVVGLPRVYVGAVLGVVIFFIIRSGTHSISALTNVLVPIMSVGYAVMSAVVIFRGRAALGDAFDAIFRSAFTPSAAASGVGGYIFTKAVRYGIMRGLVSNEAGCGTAPTAHAIADCPSPAKQGMFGIFEVFVDTVVLCTMTALVVILGYGDASRFGGNYMMMTITAYASGLGGYAAYFLCVAVLCFGFATVLCWAHYGLTCVHYFKKNALATRVFMLVYCGAIFVGAFAPSELSWQLSDFSMGAMTVINLICILLMSKDVKKQTEIYFEK